jgi:hypothetical protein
MLEKMATSRDQTLFGTAETPEALRSPPMASREPRRLLSSTPFQSSSGEYRVNPFTHRRTRPCYLWQLKKM